MDSRQKNEIVIKVSKKQEALFFDAAGGNQINLQKYARPDGGFDVLLFSLSVRGQYFTKRTTYKSLEQGSEAKDRLLSRKLSQWVLRRRP